MQLAALQIPFRASHSGWEIAVQLSGFNGQQQTTREGDRNRNRMSVACPIDSKHDGRLFGFYNQRWPVASPKKESPYLILEALPQCLQWREKSLLTDTVCACNHNNNTTSRTPSISSKEKLSSFADFQFRLFLFSKIVQCNRVFTPSFSWEEGTIHLKEIPSSRRCRVSIFFFTLVCVFV